MNFKVGEIRRQLSSFRNDFSGEWQKDSVSLPPHLCAGIEGQTVLFKSTEDKFNALILEWRRLRDRGSSTDEIVNEAYGQIVGMGWDAVPLLLREVERQSGHWFTALKWITGTTVGDAKSRGSVRELRTAWLRWGIENGQSGRLVSRGGLAEEIPPAPST